MSWRDENIDAMLSCRTESEAFAHLKTEARRLGMPSVSWVFKTALPLENPSVTILTNFSKKWQDRYYSQKYWEQDSTVKRGLKDNLPIVWSEIPKKEAPEFWEEANAHGLVVGYAQSVFDAHGNRSMLTLSRDGTEFNDSELADKGPKIAWLAQMLHTSMSRIIVPKLFPDIDTNLTIREREALQLVARGKTSQEIADALGISKRTADWHIEEATKKLGAANRTDAAIKALFLGLI